MKKSDWAKALESMKETLEPPPVRSERKNQSRSLVQEYRADDEPVVPPPSLTSRESLTPEVRLSPEESLSQTIPIALQDERHPSEESLLSHGTPKQGTLLELAKSIQYGKGHQRIYHDFNDLILRKLPPLARYLFLCLDRYREGMSNTTVILSWPKLEEITGLSHGAMNKYIQVLEREGLAHRFGPKFGKHKEQGNRFWVFSVASLTRDESLSRNKSLASGDTNNRKDLKEKNIKGEAPKINRLAPEELSEFLVTVRDLITDGQTLEQITDRFAPSLHPEDWAVILVKVVGQGS
jgi:hypothetical protein